MVVGIEIISLNDSFAFSMAWQIGSGWFMPRFGPLLDYSFPFMFYPASLFGCLASACNR